MRKSNNPWKTNQLPNGVWEVIEYTFFDFGFTYRTVVRGITREQAKQIVAEHEKFFNA